MRTLAQEAGDHAEALVERRLDAMGWSVLGRQVRVGRLELDIVARDPGPPARLVAVEVRWRAGRAFGSAEESVDWRKRQRLRSAIGRLAEAGRFPDGRPLPALPVAVDLVTVEPPPDGEGPVRIRHHRDVLTS